MRTDTAVPTRLLAGAGAYLAFGISLTMFPMLRETGYESSLAVALFTAFVLPWVVPAFLGRLRQGEAPPEPLPLFARIVAAQTGFLLIPFAVLTVYGRVVPACAPGEGALFYLLMPVSTGVFLSALLTLLRGFLRRGVRTAYYAVFFAFLLLPVLEILSRPQLFAYNHLFGMFAGVSWDESQPPLATLAVFRATTFAYVLMMLAAAWMAASHTRHLRPRRIAAVAVFGAGLAAVLLMASRAEELGYSSSAAHTRRVLGSKVETAHFVIWYPSSVFERREIRRVAEEHEFRLRQVTRELQVRWEGRITSYIYPDRLTKRRLLGTESSQIARPWAREIHLSAEGWSASLKHELVHVVAGEFGPYPNRAPFLRVLGLVEGLAMAVEWSYGNRSLHQYAAGMFAQGMLPHARDVMSTAGFVAHSSSVGYVAGGSFCRWLMDSAGIDVIKRAYAEDDLLEATATSWDDLDARWRRFLATVPRELPDSVAVHYSFGRMPIFRRVCPRTVTELNREAWTAFTRGHAGRAATLYRRSDSLGPNGAAVFGLVRSYYQLARYDSVIAVAARYLGDPLRSTSVYPLRLWQAAAYWACGARDTARMRLEELLRERPAGWPTDEARWFRAALLDSLHAALRPLVLRGLRWSVDADEARAARLAALDALEAEHPGRPLVSAFKARALFAADSATAHAVTLTRRAAGLGPLLDFEIGTLRIRALLRLRRPDDALRELRDMQGNARFYEERALLEEMEERCRDLRRE